MRYAAALSEHGDPRVAIAEVIGQVLERIGPSPGFAVLFVSGTHIDQFVQIARAVRQGLEPGHLLGSTATSVMAHRQAVENAAAIVLWAGHTGPVEVSSSGTRLELGDTPEGSTVIVLADPLTFDADTTLSSVPPGVTLVGGLTSLPTSGTRNLFLADADVQTSGAVTAALPDGLGIVPLVSQGCRPIGSPLTVTDARQNLILELGGQTALRRLKEAVASLSEADRGWAIQHLQVGFAIDEHSGTLRPRDFLVRDVVGADNVSGSVACGGLPIIGMTAQFHIRDPDFASRELEQLLHPRQAESALLFTCERRGRRFFPRSSHDTELFCDGLGTTTVAGMFCSGEMGPAGPGHHVHGFAASGLLFGSSAAR